MVRLSVDGGYADSTRRLADFGLVISGLIKVILNENDLHVHSVTYRVKQKDSADRKMLKKANKYTGYGSLTDLLGVRVVTYFSDDVDKVSEVISSEFEVDVDNSVDKRAELEPDRFGYLSLHRILSLAENRAHMVEYRNFAGIKFEVQIRSILQHAWAEIEHDLGYKGKSTLPGLLQREFSMLAGTLELADRQFMRLRDTVTSYRREAIEKVHGLDKDIEINRESLMAYLRDNETAANVDKALARMVSGRHASLVDDADSALATARNIMDLTGIETIAALHATLRSDVAGLLSFSATFQTSPSVAAEDSLLHEDDVSSDLGADLPVLLSEIDRGICLFYLFYYILAQVPPNERRQSLERAFGRTWSDDELEQVSQDLGDALTTSRGAR